MELSHSPSKALRSDQDLSVNFVFESGQEARFVRRSDDYFIVYLSAHNGCNMACRFCHLTQSGQTAFVEASLDDMVNQARQVIAHYAKEVCSGTQPPANRVHFNWMARGEPLASSVVLSQWEPLTAALSDLAAQAGVFACRFNVSSIFPTSAHAPATGPSSPLLRRLAGPHAPVIFYSLYSLNPAFRKRWLPKARAPEEVLAELSSWQAETGGELVLHWALIQGENDTAQDAAAIVEAIQRHRLKARFNLVRYNPFGESQGAEAPEDVLADRLQELSSAMLLPGSRMVARVGFDVKASCGMFVLQNS